MDSKIIKQETTGIKTKELVLTGLMAALICVMGPLSLPIPISPVPISLATLAIYFSVYILGMKRSTISCLIYLLIGFVGLPVFSGFTSGPAKLLGPTGGYMVGYIVLTLVCGAFIDKWRGRLIPCFAGMVFGTLVFYAIGTAWLSVQGHMSFGSALAAGVLPFIPGDLAKIIVVVLVGPQICKRLRKAGLNES